MISENAVTLNPRMPLLISLRSVITVFDCSGTVLFSAAQVFLNASNVRYFCFKIPVPLPQSGKYTCGLSTMLFQSPPHPSPRFLESSPTFLK